MLESSAQAIVGVADDRCIAPIATLDPGGRALIVYQEDLGSIGNNFIGARPGHPVIQRALSNGAAAINRGDSDILWLSTGPGLLTRSFAAWKTRASWLANGAKKKNETSGFTASRRLARKFSPVCWPNGAR